MHTAVAVEKPLLDAANGSYSELASVIPSAINMYRKDIDFQHLHLQLQMLPGHIQSYNQSYPNIAIRRVSVLGTICEIMNVH